jgi:ankyrin repeat protein
MSSLDEFVKAIDDGDSSMVESLISRSVVDVNVRLPRTCQRPALVHAACGGQQEIVDILLRANARIDDTDERGWTACHVAAMFGRHDVLVLLLARQPNLAVVDVHGNTALCYAALLSAYDDGRSALMLLEAGASLEAVRHDHLCHFASTSTDAIRALTTRGVVVRAIVARNGATPLHCASLYTRDADVFDLLVNVCGINVNLPCRDGQTCAHSAAIGQNSFALGWLIKAGADVNVADNDGGTPLQRVSTLECAVMLLAAGANVCARDNNGQTPLHCVALEGNSFAAVHALLAAGADLDVANDAGESARQVLARRGLTIKPSLVEAARRIIAKARLDFVRDRALQVCIGLQSLELDALQMCEILQFACGPVAPLIPFHIWWKIATTVKHFRMQ